MTSRERFLAAVRGDTMDRVPVAPYCGNFGAVLAGIPISIYNTDPKKMAEAQIRAWEAVGQDVVVAQSDNYYIAEGFGCRINQPVNTTPNLTAPAVESLDQVDRLKVPDPWKDGRMPVYLEAVALLREHFGTEVAVRAPGTGPFSLASYLVGGTAEFLTQIALCEADEDCEKEEQLFRVMELASDALILFLKAALEAGSDTAQAGDSLASLSMISPAIYEKYVYPYEVKVFSALAPVTEEKGAVTILHICGDTRKILPLMAKTGVDVLEIDAKVDLADARELAGPSVALMGNLEPTTVLFQGTPELIRKESERCIESADGPKGGFILGSGCEVVPGTPAENLKAMVEAAVYFSS
ncbi:uroporphyrinogen decarboxylase family protein [Marispirochaeta sp.]|uniref:uroporphyrinogen decarboxylase family protein n=1 Tax=Marispirochaeta sp. TaxID=2038653 RepID=UPI0029C6A106|nr:uroporphyrinogen decarboxylase family protein [Marispirochaeta sp.]